MSAIEVNFFPPPPSLEHVLVGIRVISHTNSTSVAIKTCPNGTPGIIFQLSKDGDGCIQSITTRTKKTVKPPVLFLHGLGSEPSVMKFKSGSYTSIQVVLKPQALRQLFGIDASKLTQHLLTAPEFGATELEKQLIDEPASANRVKLLEAFLLKQQKLHSADDIVDQALSLIHEQVSSITVKSLVDQLRTSERQLQKRFLRAVGCSPQQYIRVKRVNEALRLIKSSQYKKLSDIAYALGYYDQSHFIRDIKALSWLTPKDITQSVSDFKQDESGASYT